MKATKICCAATVSRNFQSYKVEIEAELENIAEMDNPETFIRQLQARCRKLAKEQLAIDSPKMETLK